MTYSIKLGISNQHIFTKYIIGIAHVQLVSGD